MKDSSSQSKEELMLLISAAVGLELAQKWQKKEQKTVGSRSPAICDLCSTVHPCESNWSILVVHLQQHVCYWNAL